MRKGRRVKDWRGKNCYERKERTASKGWRVKDYYERKERIVRKRKGQGRTARKGRKGQ